MSKAKRVIKRKIPIIKIILLITLVVGIAVGILMYNPQVRQEIASLISGKVESYDINDCIKAAYTEDGNRYIPIYYNNYKEQITREDIINKFAERGVEVESISSTTIGTGTVVRTKSTSLGTTYNSSYTVIIYGDVNGDGKVNVLDINRIVEYYLNKGAGSSNLTGAYAKAANVEEISKNQINVLDINRIVGFMFYENAVVEVLPYSDISRDKTPPTIELNGNSTETIVIGNSYVDAGVTVTDNLDPHVKVTSDPDPNSIDTSYEHTVTIIYTAEDAAGNKSSISRTVIVEPKIDIKIELNDPSAEYKAVSLGEEYNQNWLGANAVNVRNGIEGESLTVTGPTWDKEFDKDVPGVYKITYTASNSQGTKSIEQIIEVIDPVKTIYLDVANASSRYDGKYITEDDELDLNDIIVTLNRDYNKADEEISLKNLLSKYKNQFEIKIQEFDGTKVKYTSPADKTAEVSTNLTAKLTWTNPAESAKADDKTAEGTGNIGTAKITR